MLKYLYTLLTLAIFTNNAAFASDAEEVQKRIDQRMVSNGERPESIIPPLDRFKSMISRNEGIIEGVKQECAGLSLQSANRVFENRPDGSVHVNNWLTIGWFESCRNKLKRHQNDNEELRSVVDEFTPRSVEKVEDSSDPIKSLRFMAYRNQLAQESLKSKCLGLAFVPQIPGEEQVFKVEEDGFTRLDSWKTGTRSFEKCRKDLGEYQTSTKDILGMIADFSPKAPVRSQGWLR